MSSIALDGAGTTGHGQFPPSTLSSTATTVIINGKPPLLNGDPMATHCDPSPSCHGSIAIASTQKIFINGKAVIQVGDSTSCGDTIADGSSNVFIG